MDVSIIIPCYNSSKYVTRAIESVLNQTYKNWELILVNNNSIDNTDSILKMYKERYPNNIIVVNETKKGAPAARNRGLSLSRGEWIQFLDSDDELPNNKIERQLRIGKMENTDVIVGNYLRIVTINGIRYNLKFLPLISKNIWEALLRGRLGITSANLWRKASIKNIGGWDESLNSTQEYDLMFRLLINEAKFSFDIKDKPTLIFCEHESITRSSDPPKNELQFLAFVKLRERIKEYLIKKNLFNQNIQNIINEEIYNCYLYKRQYLSPELKHKYEKTYPSFLPKLKLYSIYIIKKIIQRITSRVN